MHDEKRTYIIAFLQSLREQIIHAFEEFETTTHRFEKKPWKHNSGGGGEIGILRGKHFERAAVNWSGVWGEKYPMAEGMGPFFATGISLITHMSNPHAPTVHMNIRYMETAAKSWFGGGYDLTPMGFPYAEDTDHFHSVAQAALGPFNLYEEFAKNAKEYFYIPHRHKERGVGGIFFDHYNSGNFEEDLAMWKKVGETFLASVVPIYQKRIHQPFSREEREKQLEMRGHYVEFNLLHDRGTKFGFQSGGNPEAILCSLPPLAKW